MAFIDSGEVLEITKDNTAIVQAGIKKAIMNALEEIGLKAEKYAKKLTPVDTGRPRNSITHRIDIFGTAVYIGTYVSYGKYVEMGVSTWDGSGPKKAPKGGYKMLRRAATEHGEEYRDIIKKHLGGSH